MYLLHLPCVASHALEDDQVMMLADGDDVAKPRGTGKPVVRHQWYVG